MLPQLYCCSPQRILAGDCSPSNLGWNCPFCWPDCRSGDFEAPIDPSYKDGAGLRLLDMRRDSDKRPQFHHNWAAIRLDWVIGKHEEEEATYMEHHQQWMGPGHLLLGRILPFAILLHLLCLKRMRVGRLPQLDKAQGWAWQRIGQQAYRRGGSPVASSILQNRRPISRISLSFDASPARDRTWVMIHGIKSNKLLKCLAIVALLVRKIPLTIVLSTLLPESNWSWCLARSTGTSILRNRLPFMKNQASVQQILNLHGRWGPWLTDKVVNDKILQSELMHTVCIVLARSKEIIN